MMKVCQVVLVRRWVGWPSVFAAMGLLLAGCRGTAPEAVPPPNVDPAAAAGEAMKLYDANGDGSLDNDEVAKCPPLASATTYDIDGNGQVTADEIANRLKTLFNSGVSLTSVNCTVTLSGRPLPGAKVVLRPVTMLSESIQPAEGETDELGSVVPTVDRQHLPQDFDDAPMMQPGLYHVEITHPRQKLAERYNASTELGCEVGPGSRGGNNLRFALKP